MSVRCGNHTEPTTHETVSDVRACYQGNRIPTQRNPLTPEAGSGKANCRKHGALCPHPARCEGATDLGTVVNERLVRAHANNPRTVQVLASVGAGNQWRDDNPLGDEATTNQITYIEGLVEKRDLTGHISPATRRTAQAVADGEIITFEAARSALDELTKLPRKPRQTDAAAACGEQGTRTQDNGLVARIRGLKALVPDGRYACNPEGVGQDKLHFYLVKTGKTGRVFIKEYASDALFESAFTSYEAILTTIIEDGVEASGMLFGEEYGACRKCGRGLTDENNPYKEMGYGPDCGAKL